MTIESFDVDDKEPLPVEVHYDSKAGRHVKATRDIKVCDV